LTFIYPSSTGRINGDALTVGLFLLDAPLQAWINFMVVPIIRFSNAAHNGLRAITFFQLPLDLHETNHAELRVVAVFLPS
jgi:hypothetical protein